MDLSLSVMPETVAGDWRPTAMPVSPEGTGRAFGQVFGEAMAVAAPSSSETLALPGCPPAFDATTLLSLTAASPAEPLRDLVPTGVADAAAGTDRVPVEASEERDETQADDLLNEAVVAPLAPDAVSALPWGIPAVAIPTTPPAEVPGTDDTVTRPAFGAPGTRRTGLPSAGGGGGTGTVLEVVSTGTVFTGASLETVSGLAAARGPVAARAEAMATADAVGTAPAEVASDVVGWQRSAPGFLSGALGDSHAAPHEAEGADLRRTMSDAASEVGGGVWTAASPVARAEVLRSLLSRPTSAESVEPSLANLVKSMSRPDTNAPRAGLLLAQALRPLDLSAAAPGGAERLESVLVSRDLDATLEAGLPPQLIDAIRLQVRDGVREARIRLRPEVLGDVAIAISVVGGAVSATIEAESPSVRQWIERHEGLLRERLSEQGLQLAQLEVRADERARDGERQRRDQREASQPVVMSRAQREAAARRFAAML